MFDKRIASGASSAALAWADIKTGWNGRDLWWYAAYSDIQLRYRRSIVGPLWLTLNICIIVVAMGLLYGELFHQDLAVFLPYVAAGYLTWSFVSVFLTEGCKTFMSVYEVVRNTTAPLSSYVFRDVARNFLIFAHSVVVMPILYIIWPQHITWKLLLSIPALGVLVINAVWISALFGMLSARFRDVPQIVLSLLQVVMFVTPLFWPISALGERAYIAEFNPFYHAVEILRAPLLGEYPQTLSMIVMAAITICGSSFTFLVFARYRQRIVLYL